MGYMLKILLPLWVKHPYEIALMKKENVVFRVLLGPSSHASSWSEKQELNSFRSQKARENLSALSS